MSCEIPQTGASGKRYARKYVEPARLLLLPRSLHMPLSLPLTTVLALMALALRAAHQGHGTPYQRSTDVIPGGMETALLAHTWQKGRIRYQPRRTYHALAATTDEW